MDLFQAWLLEQIEESDRAFNDGDNNGVPVSELRHLLDEKEIYEKVLEKYKELDGQNL